MRDLIVPSRGQAHCDDSAHMRLRPRIQMPALRINSKAYTNGAAQRGNLLEKKRTGERRNRFCEDI